MPETPDNKCVLCNSSNWSLENVLLYCHACSRPCHQHCLRARFPSASGARQPSFQCPLCQPPGPQFDNNAIIDAPGRQISAPGAPSHTRGSPNHPPGAAYAQSNTQSLQQHGSEEYRQISQLQYMNRGLSDLLSATETNNRNLTKFIANPEETDSARILELDTSQKRVQELESDLEDCRTELRSIQAGNEQIPKSCTACEEIIKENSN